MMQNRTPLFPGIGSLLIPLREGESGDSAWGLGRFPTTEAAICRVICALLLVVVVSTCYAADVVLLRSSEAYQLEVEAIRRVSGFYGVNLQIVDVGSRDAVNQAMSQLSKPGALAVLTSEEALSKLGKSRLQRVLRRPKGRSVPMLVFGIQAGEDTNLLKSWSGGALRECAPLADNFRAETLGVLNVGALTRTLAGLELPAVASPVCNLQFEAVPRVQPVLSVRGHDRASSVVLVRAQNDSAEIFFAPQMKPFDVSWVGKAESLPRAFSSMAPFIFFLSYAAGEYAWHSDGHYANLTIDDAWLTQPYGHLDYPALLAEMEKHNFHTTIAFIPWNFDRSELGIADLFKARPERFSICIHGDDHDHREFSDYATNPLAVQVAHIRQSVARMERFHVLTGIPYDRFMVFPHGIAPEDTFVALKRYEFLGTANLVNVPLGATFPADPAFLLRPATVSYAQFLSLSRYPVEEQVPRLEIAIQSFLGNPLLFYGHENLFDRGIDAFAAHADLVNQVQPDTQWTSLGEIARHSHLLRRREDGGFDVWMLANEADLRNTSDGDAVFYIQKKEDPSAKILSLTIDGTTAAFERSGNMLTSRLEIPAHQLSRIRVGYQNDLDVMRVDIRKNSLHAYALRRISDFRDLHLSRSSWGNAITQAYYHHGWNAIEVYLERRWWIGVMCIGLVFGAALFWRVRRRPA